MAVEKAYTNVDVLIIGGGPGGLSAALALCRQRHSCIVFDSGEYRNATTSRMHNISTWDHKDPAAFRAAARAETLDRYDTAHFVSGKVVSLSKTSDTGFEARDEQGTVYQGKKVILATGSEDTLPDIPGYAELWGDLIFQCLFCHGYEQRDCDEAGILAVEAAANVPESIRVGGMAKRLAKKVIILTNGNVALADEMKAPASKKGFEVESKVIAGFAKSKTSSDDEEIEVTFADGTTRNMGFISHRPKSKLRGPLAEQLGLALTPSGDIAVTPPFGEASLKGVFAVGDCGSMLKVISAAISSGSFAGGGAAAQLQQEE